MGDAKKKLSASWKEMNDEAAHQGDAYVEAFGKGKKVAVESLDELKSMAKAFGKKLVNDVSGESKKTFSTTKALSEGLERVDAVTDAPKRAFVGAAKKTGSLSEGAKAAVKQFKSGILEGKLLDDTPEYQALVEDDMVSKGIPRKLAESNSGILGGILDVAGSGVGAGELVGGAKVAGKVAKRSRGFLDTTLLEHGLSPQRGSTRVPFGHPDFFKHIEKARQTKHNEEVFDAIKGEQLSTRVQKGVDVTKPDYPQAIPGSKKATDILVPGGDGVDQAVKSTQTKHMKNIRVKEFAPGPSKAQQTTPAKPEPKASPKQYHNEDWKPGDQSILEEEVADLRAELLASGVDPKDLKKSPTVKKLQQEIDLHAEGNKAKAFEEGRYVGPEGRVKGQKDTTSNSIFAESTEDDDWTKANTPQREFKAVSDAAVEKSWADKHKKRYLDGGKEGQGAQSILEGIPNWHSNSEGLRGKIVKGENGREKLELFESQPIASRPSQEKDRGFKKFLESEERLDSDDEPFILRKEIKGDAREEAAQKRAMADQGNAEDGIDQKQIEKATKLGVEDAERLTSDQAERAIEAALPSEKQVRFAGAFKMPGNQLRDLSKKQASQFISRVKELDLQPADLKNFWMKGGTVDELDQFKSADDFFSWGGRPIENMDQLKAKAGVESKAAGIQTKKEDLRVEKKSAVGATSPAPKTKTGEAKKVNPDEVPTLVRTGTKEENKAAIKADPSKQGPFESLVDFKKRQAKLEAKAGEAKVKPSKYNYDDWDSIRELAYKTSKDPSKANRGQLEGLLHFFENKIRNPTDAHREGIRIFRSELAKRDGTKSILDAGPAYKPDETPNQATEVLNRIAADRIAAEEEAARAVLPKKSKDKPKRGEVTSLSDVRAKAKAELEASKPKPQQLGRYSDPRLEGDEESFRKRLKEIQDQDEASAKMLDAEKDRKAKFPKLESVKQPGYSKMTLETYLNDHFKPKEGEKIADQFKRARLELRDLKAKKPGK